MKPMLLLATVIIALAATPALAQEAQCFQNDQYLVIAQERVDEVGADFIIRSPAKGKIACVFEEQAGDRRIGALDDPLHYEGLAGQYLVLTRSTGPQGDLVVYDLSTDLFAPLIDARAEDEVTITDESITYWQHLILGTAVNCPEFAEHSGYDLGSMIYEERVFDLATVTIAATGNTRCSSTQ
ncbi:MAG: hypothetical protein WBA73_01985 [Devosia sp.]